MINERDGSGRRPRRQLTQILSNPPGGGAPAAPSAQQAVTGPAGYGTPPPATGVGNPGRRGFSPERAQRRMGRLAWENARRAQGPLWEQVQQMLDGASPANRAANLAPQMEAIGRFEDRARGEFDADAMARGLDGTTAESSYAGLGRGAISADANRLRVGAVVGQQQREQQLAASNAAFLSALQSGNMEAAARIVESMRQADFQQQQLDAQSGFGWGDLGSLIGSAAGIGFAGGWRPFGPAKR